MQSQSQSFRLILEALERVLNRDAVAALITVIQSPDSMGAKLLVEESLVVTGSTGDSALDQALVKQAVLFLDSHDETKAFRSHDFAPELKTNGEVRVMFERIEPESRLVICGAGHVGASLARMANFLGYRTTLIDDRAEFLTRERFPEERIELMIASSWAEAVHEAISSGRGVSVAVVTRGHNEDEECMRAVMAMEPDYIGLIGSKRRTNIVLDRLRQAGVAEDKLRKVRAPVGLDIRAVTPEEVALSILAEIVAERRGGKGGSLSAWRRELCQPQ
jgi:xanthine dehydrogenase accessory factor